MFTLRAILHELLPFLNFWQDFNHNTATIYKRIKDWAVQGKMMNVKSWMTGIRDSSSIRICKLRSCTAHINMLMY